MTLYTGAPPQPLILFLHLPKTGGSTLRSIIRRHYPPEALREVTLPRASAAELQAFARTVSADDAIIQGHFWCGLHRFLLPASTYVTLLRHPVDRAISQYYHTLREPRWGRPHRVLASEGITLKAWTSDGRFPQVPNLQTRRLSGAEPTREPCTEAMLEMAKRNLRERFSVVGITERFDETVVLLKRTFRWRSVLYSKQNMGANRPATAALGEDALRAIEDANRLDIELYNYAQGIFEEQLRRQGPDFEMELEAFRRVNRQYAGHPSILRL